MNINPQHATALEARGDLFRKQDKCAEALKDYERINDPSPSILFKKAKVHRSQERFGEAILLEHEAHQLQLKQRKLNDAPSLQAFCKWAFFANEATLYANKKIFKSDPNQIGKVF